LRPLALITTAFFFRRAVGQGRCGAARVAVDLECMRRELKAAGRAYRPRPDPDWLSCKGECPIGAKDEDGHYFAVPL
jgi:hypothetical protein